MTVAAIPTPRLDLQPWSAAYFDHFARWAADPAVMRFIGDGSAWDAEGVADRHRRQQERWARLGWGWRFAVERKTGQVVGLAAAQPTLAGRIIGVSEGEHEIGWWVDPAHWNKGFATEMGGGLLDEAFGRLGAPYVIAIIQPENVASVNVARKLGFHIEGEAHDPAGGEVVVMRTDRPYA